MGWFAGLIDYSVREMFLVPTLRESCRPRRRQAAYVAKQPPFDRIEPGSWPSCADMKGEERDSAAKKTRVADFGSKHFSGRGWNFARKRA
jgi:hypothetical protein